jgi:hypothetical protein
MHKLLVPVVVLVGAAFLLFDPDSLVGVRPRSYSYGAAEMRAAVEGTWELPHADRYDRVHGAAVRQA